MALGNELPQRSPDTFSGMICASAPRPTETARFLTSPWAPAGASRATLKIVPEGAFSVMGLNAPSFKAPPGSRVDLIATNTPAPATASELFTTPGTCALLPVKSAVIWSPATVSFRRASTGSSWPSL